MASPKPKSKFNPKYTGLLLLGSSVIILTMAWITWNLYQNGVNNEVLTSNYQSSILLSSSAATGSGAAPYALAGLNWFICKTGIKTWRKYLQKKLGLKIKSPHAKN